MIDGIDVRATGNLLEVRATGKLTHAFYEAFVPAVEQQLQQCGKLRILFEMHDFHGWTAGALWDDVKFDAKHWHDIERLAVVGESKWEHGMAVFCKPFTSAKVRYFDKSQAAEAREWVQAS